MNFEKRTSLKHVFGAVLLAGAIILLSCSDNQGLNNITGETEAIDSAESVLKLEMNLSAFGVEADHIPNISATIDFVKKTSNCVKSYYNPTYDENGGGDYQLSNIEMNRVEDLLEATDLSKLKKNYSVNYSDQPRSTTKIITSQNEYMVDDYGLVGDAPLQQLYKIVYQY